MFSEDVDFQNFGRIYFFPLSSVTEISFFCEEEWSDSYKKQRYTKNNERFH